MNYCCKLHPITHYIKPMFQMTVNHKLLLQITTYHTLYWTIVANYTISHTIKWMFQMTVNHKLNTKLLLQMTTYLTLYLTNVANHYQSSFIVNSYLGKDLVPLLAFCAVPRYISQTVYSHILCPYRSLIMQQN